MKKRIAVVCIIVIVIVLGLAFKDLLIRSYVSVFHKSLEVYASNLLNECERRPDRFGFWKTSVYPEDGMVEFKTGGWGLAPGSTYKGFYYSVDNSHKLFSAAQDDAAAMVIDGDNAEWTDGTDNKGISVRITENWFWFEASF